MSTKNPTTTNSIPAKVPVTCSEVCTEHITNIYNKSICDCAFPEPLKLADITPVHKKDETTLKQTIDQLASYRQYQKYLKEICIMKLMYLWKSIFLPTYVGFVEGSLRSIVL